MKDVLLINLSSYPEFSVGTVFPIGLNKIKSYLMDRGYECMIYDYHKEPILDINDILGLDFRFIGIGIRNLDTLELDSKLQYKKYINFINEFYRIKIEKGLESSIVIGGAGYSLYYEKFNKLIQYDFGISGNGEHAFLQLLQGNTESKNIISSASCQERIIYDEELVRAYLKANTDLSIGVQTYEGKCPKQCIYCCYNYKDVEFTTKKVTDVVIEIEQLLSLNVKCIFIVDQVFNITDDYAIYILKHIKEKINFMRFMAFLNPSLNEELYLLIKDCGLFPIYSFDSFSTPILSSLKKDFTVEEIRETIKICRQYEIPFSSSLILGAIGENENTIKETCTFINKYFLEKSELSISFGIRIVPKSRLFDLTIDETKDYLKPIFLYFSPDIFDYFYKYINKRLINTERFLKHCHYKNAYYLQEYVQLIEKKG